MSSFLMSLLSPVLRKMVCGNFKESICKKIRIVDVAEARFVQLVQLACGNEGLVAENIEALIALGELSERLQMVAVTKVLEDLLVKELRMETCAELFRRGEASGLRALQQACYDMLRDGLEHMSQTEGFLWLSEEMMEKLLDEDELGAGGEEDVFEAVVRWMDTNMGDVRGDRLLRKIRYGIVEDAYLAGRMLSALPGHRILKELIGEAMTKKTGRADGEVEWDGVERLCDKWTVARGFKGKIVGADVLDCPRFVAVDAKGRAYVSDQKLHQVLVFRRDGSLARRLGASGTAPGQFREPRGVAVDRHGRVVVADCNNHRVQVLAPDGAPELCIGSYGSGVGQLRYPQGVAVDRDGRIAVADHLNSRVQLFNPDGSVAAVLGSKGTGPGRLNFPTDVAVVEAPAGGGRRLVAVADTLNHRVQVFDPADGAVALCFGSYGDGPGQFDCPCGLDVDWAGRYFVSDNHRHRVQVFDSDGRVVRAVGAQGSAVGQLKSPYGVAVDGAGRVLVADCGNKRVQVL